MEWGEAKFHIISTRGINCDIEQVTVLNNRFIVCLPLYPNQPHGIRVKRKCNQVSKNSSNRHILFITSYYKNTTLCINENDTNTLQLTSVELSVLGAFFSFRTRFLSLSVLLPKRSMLCCCFVWSEFITSWCFPFKFRSHSLIAILLQLLF